MLGGERRGWPMRRWPPERRAKRRVHIMTAIRRDGECCWTRSRRSTPGAMPSARVDPATHGPCEVLPRDEAGAAVLAMMDIDAGDSRRKRRCRPMTSMAHGLREGCSAAPDAGAHGLQAAVGLGMRLPRRICPWPKTYLTTFAICRHGLGGRAAAKTSQLEAQGHSGICGSNQPVR